VTVMAQLCAAGSLLLWDYLDDVVRLLTCQRRSPLFTRG
jgi:hypothetical protein